MPCHFCWREDGGILKWSDLMPVTLSRRTFLVNAAAVPAATLIPTGVATPARPSVTTASLIDAERGVIRSAMDGSGIGAAAVCLVEGGQVRWTEGFGHVSGQGSVPVDASTMFSIQSTSKNFAAVAVLLAVQDGILDLDAPITRYLPSFTVRSRFEHAPQERISLRLLLANRAGFTHEAPLGNNYEPASPGFDAHVRSISQTWLRFPVGTRYRYSNLGFDLAGHVLEQVAGISYPAWLQRRIFEPLGMRDSTADASIYLASKGRALGTQEGHAQVPPVTPLVVSGGVWTSAADMAKYLGFLLGGGRSGAQQLLEPHLWDEMHGFGLGGDYGLGVMRSERLYGSTPVRLLHHRGGGLRIRVRVHLLQAGKRWICRDVQSRDVCGVRHRRASARSAVVGAFRAPSAACAPIKPGADQVDPGPDAADGGKLDRAQRQGEDRGCRKRGAATASRGARRGYPLCGHRRRSTFHCGHRWRGCDVPLPCGDGHAAGVPGMQQRRGWPGPERSHRWAHRAAGAPLATLAGTLSR
ncbi:serine hydrolase domain-containing protein [Stenotrophomonas maltophilia group sp. msm4]|uniref:serine hydrolase domain-containing protein n=1 Tax=Stenotrophomonas maltophilia group TaxID=995085 RepID=UPI002155725B|nr:MULTISPECIES: serine hydrolase domain-containing protein [Stenotrophomonas maltophilia group]MDT3492009.1 serine hydrolase domain-containing protein [Stenotrophomonas maltophilia group sp. msm4]